MAVQHNVINGICAGCKYFLWASHSDAIAKARVDDGSVNGRPSGVRMARPSSVTVCHDDVGVVFRREDQREGFGIVTPTPVALCDPSTPAEIGDSTSVLCSFCCAPMCGTDGAEVGFIPTFL